MCIEDIRNIIAEYKIYDYEGNRQTWNEYDELLDKIENDRKDNLGFESEEEYWQNEENEWGNVL